MKYTLKRTILFGLLLLQMTSAAAQSTIFSYSNPQPLHEVRAVWLTTLMGLDWPHTKAIDAKSIQKQKDELCEILDNLQYVHINTVIFQTRLRGSVIYPSAYEPWNECLTGTAGKNPGYDPLKFCIDECHARGMECHAWVVAIPLGKVAQQNAYGNSSLLKKKADLCRTVGEDAFMLPGNPATADYIANICREIASKYDVDGINLDYIRYPESSYKFSDDDLYSFKGSSMNKVEWRRNNITRIVKAVHDKVKAVKPWIKLSSSPVGKYRNIKTYNNGGWNCLEAVYQDPAAWLRDGIQDMIFPMMYYKDNDFYPYLCDWQESCNGRPVCPGLGIYFLDPKEGKWVTNDVRAEMFTTRRKNMGGMAMFRSDFLTRNCGGLFDCCYEELFMYPSLTPRMTWEADTVAPAVPGNLHFTAGRMIWDISTDYCPSAVVMPSQHNYVTYNVYGSSKCPVDTRNAENLLYTRVMGNSFNIENISGSKKYFAVTAVDRFGNESVAAQGMYDEGDLARNLDIRSLINNTYQTAIPQASTYNYAEIGTADTTNVGYDYDFSTSFGVIGLDIANANLTKQSKADKYRSRERIVLVPVRSKKDEIDEEPKKLSITARNNLRKKQKREQREREKNKKEE